MPSLSTTSSAHRTCCDGEGEGCGGVSSAARRRRVGGAEGPEAWLVMVCEPDVGALLEVRRWVGGWLDIFFDGFSGGEVLSLGFGAKGDVIVGSRLSFWERVVRLDPS